MIWRILASPIGNYGTATIDQWSLDWVVRFSIGLILWELLFVGLPALLFFGIGGYLWWQQLSSDEKASFKKQEAKKHRARNYGGGGGGGGLFLFIAYCIVVSIDGNYFTAFGALSYSYWVFSYLVMLGWLLIIFGIPLAVAGLTYLRYWLNQP